MASIAGYTLRVIAGTDLTSATATAPGDPPDLSLATVLPTGGSSGSQQSLAAYAVLILSALQPATLATALANCDLSGLPTSNPGGGRPWLNGGVLQVGA